MIIKLEQKEIERIEAALNHLDRLSVKFWGKMEEAEKAGDTEAVTKYKRKMDMADEKQIGYLECLDKLGLSWKTDLLPEGVEKFHLLPGLNIQ